MGFLCPRQKIFKMAEEETASSFENQQQKLNMEEDRDAGSDENEDNNDVCDEDNPSISAKEQLSVEEKEKDSTEEENADKSSQELVNFRIVWNKKNYDVQFDVGQTVDKLKEHIQGLTGLPVSMQKLMYKGLLKDGSKVLRDLNITSGCKMMVVGSTINDVLKVTPPAPSQLKEEKGATATPKEPLCKQKMHKKVLDKGKPDDVIPGIKNRKESLPNVPLSGMYNKYGSKVRLTFKLELDQLWLGTKERTEKIPMGSIKNVVSEPIEGHEEYHMLAIQLGPTEASRYWIYWVPAQYVNAIKDTILGKWQPF